MLFQAVSSERPKNHRRGTIKATDSPQHCKEGASRQKAIEEKVFCSGRSMMTLTIGRGLKRNVEGLMAVQSSQKFVVFVESETQPQRNSLIKKSH